MIVYDNDPGGFLATWLCKRILYTPTEHLRVIARVNEQNQILGVVGYDCFNGASCQMHVAGVGNWVSRHFLFAAFDYPFNTCNLKCLLGLTPSSKEDAIRFNQHIGFTEVLRLEDAHPDGALIVYRMYKTDCRWIGHVRSTLTKLPAELRH